jgi:drug/metabolite transporter (DMT)-like permease
MTTQNATSRLGAVSAAAVTDSRSAFGSQRTLTIAALLAVYIIWGTTYLAIRVALENFPPYTMMGSRFIVAGGLLFMFVKLRGAPLPSLKQARNAALIGGLLLVGGMGSAAVAEQWVTSGLTAALVAVMPLWAIVFGMIWRRFPTRNEWIGAILGIIGVALLTFEGNLQANPLGIVILLFGTLCWSFGSVWSRYLELPQGVMGNAMQMLFGGVVMCGIALVTGEQIKTPISPNAALAWIYLVIAGSLVAMTAYAYLLKTVSPVLATSYAFVNPVIALFLGVALAGETLTGSALIGLPVILLGVAFVMWKRR